MITKASELKEVIMKLVPMLAGKGLKVTQRGSRAYVEVDPNTKKPLRVNIPNVGDDSSESFVAAISGFIDHEVAHVLFTDWNIYGGSPSQEDLQNVETQKFMNAHNIVEDTMIEKEMAKVFPGSKGNIGDLRKHFISKITKPAIAAAKSDKEVFNYLMVPVIRALAGHEEFQDFLDEGGYWSNPMVDSLVKSFSPDGLKLLKTARTTKQTLVVAKELYDILYSPPPPAPTPPPPSDDEPDEDGEPAESGPSEDKPEKEAGEGDGDGERDHKKTEETEDEPGDEDEAADPKSDADENSEDEEDGKADKSSEPEEGEGSEDGDDEPGEGGSEEDDDDGDDDHHEPSDGEGSSDEPDDADGDYEPEQSDGPGGESDDGDEDQDGPSTYGSAGSAEDDGGEPDSEDETDDGVDKGEDNSPVIKPDGAEDDGETHDGSDEDGDEGLGVGCGTGKSMFEFDDDALEGRDISEEISVLISNEAVDGMNHSEWTVFSTEKDEIKHLQVPDKMNDSWVRDLDEEVGRITGRMQNDVQRMMASQSHVVNIPGHKSGRLHSPSLFRIGMGDPRVFTQRQEHTSKDTAVTLLIDNSGSMQGHKMAAAMTAAYALAKTLTAVNISYEMLGFTTGDYRHSKKMMKDSDDDPFVKAGGTYDRTISLVMPIYKSFQDKFDAAVKKRVAYALNAQNGLLGNIDGECLQIAAKRLAIQPERRKVIMVLSDGQPVGSRNSGPHLKGVVETLNKSGIDTIGIGIMSTAVSRFYDKHVILNDVADLPGQVMTEIKKILM